MRKLGLSLTSVLLACSLFVTTLTIGINAEDTPVEPTETVTDVAVPEETETVVPEGETVVLEEETVEVNELDAVEPETTEVSVETDETETTEETVVPVETATPDEVVAPEIVAPSAEEVVEEDGWVEITGLTNQDLTTFKISRGNEVLTGHLRFGGIGSSYSTSSIDRPHYYVTDAAGNTTTYMFSSTGSIGTTESKYYDENGAEIFLGYYNTITFWEKEISPGYKMVQARATGRGDFEQRTTLIPSSNGTVRHEISFKNVSETEKTFGMIRRIDTELNGVDRVPVYSLGQGLGLYIDNSDEGRRVYFRTVDPSNNGSSNYSAGTYYTRDWLEYFNNTITGTGEEVRVTQLGEVLMEDADSAVFFKWNPEKLAAGATRLFSYDVGLGDDYSIHSPIVTVDEDLVDVPYGEDFIISGTWSDYDDSTTTFTYSVDGGANITLKPTASSTLNEVPFSLNIKTLNLPLGEHTVKLQSKDLDGNESNEQTITFNILAPLAPVGPYITLSERNFTIYEGTKVPVVGTILDVDSTSAITSLSYVNPEGERVSKELTTTQIDGTVQALEFDIDTSALDIGEYTFEISSVDDSGLVSNIQTVTVTVETAPIAPTINVSNKNVSLTEGETFDAQFAWTDLDSLVGTLNYSILGTSVNGTLELTKDTDSKTASVTINSDTLKAGSYAVEITITDEFGLVSNVETINLTVNAVVVVEKEEKEKPKETLPDTGIAKNHTLAISTGLVLLGLAFIVISQKKESTEQ